MSSSSANPDPRLYVQVSDALREQIMDGTLKAGAPMPSLGEIAASFTVHRRTARHAMQVLASERLVQFVHGGLFRPSGRSAGQ
jgi:DNA-binding GntR family transcriptional regulator